MQPKQSEADQNNATYQTFHFSCCHVVLSTEEWVQGVLHLHDAFTHTHTNAQTQTHTALSTKTRRGKKNVAFLKVVIFQLQCKRTKDETMHRHVLRTARIWQYHPNKYIEMLERIRTSNYFFIEIFNSIESHKQTNKIENYWLELKEEDRQQQKPWIKLEKVALCVYECLHWNPKS